jgi:hypothetical protein
LVQVRAKDKSLQHGKSGIFFEVIIIDNMLKKPKLQGSATREDLLGFWREYSTSLVGQKTRKNAPTRYSKLPLVVVYYNVDFTVQYREGRHIIEATALKNCIQPELTENLQALNFGEAKYWMWPIRYVLFFYYFFTN